MFPYQFRGKIFFCDFKAKAFSRFFYDSVTLNYRLCVFYLVETPGKNQVPDMTGIYRTLLKFFFIVWIVPIFIDLEFIFEYTVDKIVYIRKRTVLASFIDNPFYRFYAELLDSGKGPKYLVGFVICME